VQEWNNLTGNNMLAAEQCGGIPVAYGQQVCKRRTTGNETTSKPPAYRQAGALRLPARYGQVVLKLTL
jgi:hypothetical protein